MTSTEIAAGTMPRWTVHLCSTTEDQRAFEHALRTLLSRIEDAAYVPIPAGE